MFGFDISKLMLRQYVTLFASCTSLRLVSLLEGTVSAVFPESLVCMTSFAVFSLCKPEAVSTV